MHDTAAVRLVSPRSFARWFALSVAPLHAQPVPTTVRIVFPFAPGGSGDALSRLIADQMSKALGTTVIVENRSGGAGRIGVRDVARSAPDGATLLLTPIAPMSVYQHVYKNLDYDPIKDFAPVSQLCTFDFGIAVGPQVAAKSLKELVAWVKAHPEQGNFGSPAVGTLPHFLGVMFGRAAGLNLVHVAYRGSAAALADVMAGHVAMIVTTTSDLVQMREAGRIHILATSDKDAVAVRAGRADLPRGRLRPGGGRLVRRLRAGQDAAGAGRALQQGRWRRRCARRTSKPRLLAFGHRARREPVAAELARIQKDDIRGLGAGGAGVRLYRARLRRTGRAVAGTRCLEAWNSSRRPRAGGA